MKRENVLEEELISRTVKVYPSDWNLLKELIEARNENMSYRIRNMVKSEIKKEKRRLKCSQSTQ